MRSLHHPPGGLAIAQPVGSIHAHPINDLPSVVGHQSRTHVHGNGLGSLAALFAQQLEEGAHLLAAAITPDP